MKRNALFFTLLVSLFLADNQVAQAELGFFDIGSKRENPVTADVAEKITTTIKKLPEEGTHISHIKLIEGIRAMDGEIVSAGEVKILVDLDWQALPSHPDKRQALDNAAARIVRTVFFAHNDITKLRVIVRIPKSNGDYHSAAKVFSFTRSMWELIKDDMRYHPDTPTGAANLLALGDYVVLTPNGWTRGY